MGDDCEWNKDTRNGNVGRNPREPHPMTVETVSGNQSLSKTETNISADALFSDGHITVSPAKMDRR